MNGQAACKSGHIEFQATDASDSKVGNLDGEIIRIQALGRGRIRLTPNREMRYVISFGVDQTIVGNIHVENNSVKVNDNWSIANNALRNHCLNNAMTRVPLVKSDVLHIQLEGAQFETIGSHNMLRLRSVNHSPDWIGIHFSPTELLEAFVNPINSMNDVEELYHDIFYHRFNEERARARDRQRHRVANA